MYTASQDPQSPPALEFGHGVSIFSARGVSESPIFWPGDLTGPPSDWRPAIILPFEAGRQCTGAHEQQDPPPTHAPGNSGPT